MPWVAVPGDGTLRGRGLSTKPCVCSAHLCKEYTIAREGNGQSPGEADVLVLFGSTDGVSTDPHPVCVDGTLTAETFEVFLITHQEG
ncbi:unnamed protein product [Arctogadus glacialis]